jgi:hypothetical protein
LAQPIADHALKYAQKVLTIVCDKICLDILFPFLQNAQDHAIHAGLKFFSLINH